MFTLLVNLNGAWYRVGKVYDASSTLEALVCSAFPKAQGTMLATDESPYMKSPELPWYWTRRIA